MADPVVEAARSVSSGVAHIVFERDGTRCGSGSGFLIGRGLVTASHVLRGQAPATVAAIRFDDLPADRTIRLSVPDLEHAVIAESPPESHDFVALALDEPEFVGRHRFGLSGAAAVEIGELLLIPGFPFETTRLASHSGRVSARYEVQGTLTLQLDANINPSNSGAPVVSLADHRVVALVTRKHTGLTDHFEEVVDALDENLRILNQPGRPSVQIGGVDPIQGLSATLAALRELALNLQRSANVGIGYAHSAHHLSEGLNA